MNVNVQTDSGLDALRSQGRKNTRAKQFAHCLSFTSKSPCSAHHPRTGRKLFGRRHYYCDVAEATLGKVEIDNNVLDKVYPFEYLGSRLQGDGDDEADVRYRMDIAQAAFASLSHLWTDHRLSRNTKLRLYNLCVCSTLTHSCEAWNLTKAVANFKWF